MLDAHDGRWFRDNDAADDDRGADARCHARAHRAGDDDASAAGAAGRGRGFGRGRDRWHRRHTVIAVRAAHLACTDAAASAAGRDTTDAAATAAAAAAAAAVDDGAGAAADTAGQVVLDCLCRCCWREVMLGRGGLLGGRRDAPDGIGCPQHVHHGRALRRAEAVIDVDACESIALDIPACALACGVWRVACGRVGECPKYLKEMRKRKKKKKKKIKKTHTHTHTKRESTIWGAGGGGAQRINQPHKKTKKGNVGGETDGSSSSDDDEGEPASADNNECHERRIRYNALD